MSPAGTREQVPTFCALCVSRCGALATVEDGVMTALSPDPSHPTGAALCIKGRVAPELVNHPRRILHPMERTRPKGDADPGWRRISWDQALDRAAERLGAIARESGPEAVVWSASSPSTTAIADAVDWIQRLRRAFGSPNLVASMELCGWGRYLASAFTWGEPVPGVYLPDLDRAGCILFWGYNPSLARLTHATAATRALRRGARLIVVDPRRVGLAHRADPWLRVRPGTDGALALALAHVMIERGWFDRDFVRRWSNGPFLVRPDDGRLLRASDLAPDGVPAAFVAWDEEAGGPVVCQPGERETRALALAGTFEIATRSGPLACRPAFALVAELCARHAPAASEEVTGVAAGDVERAARLLWESRPVAFYAWSGVEQHTNSTQTARAIAQLYALTGCIDAPGGNVRFAAVPTASVEGVELLPAETRARALGIERRPLGAARFEFITCGDFYTAALEGRPYRARGLVGFGANLLVAQPDGRRGRAALAGLDFYLHADLFMNPTAELADIVLPVASCFESEALAVGFEVSPEAQAFVQLRRAVVPPRGEARSPSGTATSTPGCATGCGRAGSTSRRCARSRPGWRSRSRLATRSTPSRRMAAACAASPPVPARSSSTRRDCWRMAIHRCRPSPSRASVRARAPIWPPPTRSSSPPPSRPGSARASTAGCPGSGAARPIRRSSSPRTPPPPAASPRGTGSRSRPRRPRCGRARPSTDRSSRRWCAASTAGGRAARR
jgi:anaerobic selenocysteine-containing dehydrogenase